MNAKYHINHCLFSGCIFLSISCARSAVQFRAFQSTAQPYTNAHITDNTVAIKQVLSNEAEEFSFIASISLLGEMEPDEHYDSLQNRPLPSSLLPT